MRLLVAKVTIITGFHLLCGRSSGADRKVANYYAELGAPIRFIKDQLVGRPDDL